MAERSGHATSQVAVLIASKDGEACIAETVVAATAQADVYVISDGSSDRTAARAQAAGARVLELPVSVGKPGALFRALFAFRLTKRYDAIAILDDDTLVAEDFVAEALKKLAPGVAIAVGKTLTRMSPTRRWNVWLNGRAYAYWRYQVTIRRGQSAFNALNCISGSNSLFRADVLDVVVRPDTPYIVDDTFWTLETHRRRLGRIVYAPEARAWVQDPTNVAAWYRQNLRWLWGTLQGIRGHRVGTRMTAMDGCAVMLVCDWMLYVLGVPLLFGLLLFTHVTGAVPLLLGYLAGYLIWIGIAAAATRHWRMLVLAPAIAATDWLYRVVFVHALAKAISQPRVAACRWESPNRYGSGRTPSQAGTSA